MSWVEQAGLVPSDASANDDFGISVAIFNNTAIVGAPFRDVSGTDSGKAYIFTRTGASWGQQGDGLVPSDVSANDSFGNSVAIYNNTAIVGARAKDASGAFSGKAYIFTYNGASWSQQAGLVPSDASANDFFGSSVGIYDNTAIVGAPINPDISGIGKAYIFTYDGIQWNQKDLIPDDPEIAAQYGGSVGIYGNNAIVGAAFRDISGIDSGKAYIFTYNGTNWSQQAGLVPSDASANYRFGTSVAIYNNTAIIGAPGGNLLKGAAYIFTNNNGSWTQTSKLLPSDPEISSFFGQSVGIYGNTAIVGANQKDAFAGKAYIFTFDGTSWNQTDLVPSDPEPYAFFGNSVGIYGNTSIVGALLRDASGENSGKAYIFGFEQQPEELTLAQQNDICICTEQICANLSNTGVTESSKITNVKDDKTIAISFNRQQEVNAVRNRSFLTFDDYLRYKQASLKHY